MKKIALLGLCCAASLAAVAQTSAVKDAERQMKANVESYPTALKTLQAAFNDPETKDGSYVWFVAGKGAMDYYDHMEGMKKIGKTVDDGKLGHALLDSYGYLITAIKNDSVVDAKGKIKTKYSKDVIKLINNHYQDFNNAGIYLWGVQDYNGAYDAWDLYTRIPNDPALGANAPAAPADTILADIYYNQALAAWQADRLQDALNSFDKSLAKGYNKKGIFDYAISVAYNLQDNAKMAEYASLAYPLYGKEDTRYIGYMINDKIANKQYGEAQKMLDEYIAADPNNAQLYYVRGILFDSQENNDAAVADYKKAIELDPNNAQALFQYGRQILNSAYTLDDQLSSLSTAEYNQARAERIDPIFREASVILERAYEADPENMHDALNLLRNIYYNLNDQDNLQRIENLQ